MIFPFPSDPILFHLLKMFQWQPSKSISQPLIGFGKKGDLDYYFTRIPPFSASQTLLVLSWWPCFLFHRETRMSPKNFHHSRLKSTTRPAPVSTYAAPPRPQSRSIGALPCPRMCPFHIPTWPAPHFLLVSPERSERRWPWAPHLK